MRALLPSSLMAIASVSMLHVAPAAAASCEPQVIRDQSYTHFPVRAQLRGQKGTVVLNIRIDAQGRATAATLQHSSGHRLLDRAAARSVLQRWQFDISSCARKDLPIEQVIGIEYRNDHYGI